MKDAVKSFLLGVMYGLFVIAMMVFVHMTFYE